MWFGTLRDWKMVEIDAVSFLNVEQRKPLRTHRIACFLVFTLLLSVLKAIKGLWKTKPLRSVSKNQRLTMVPLTKPQTCYRSQETERTAV